MTTPLRASLWFTEGELRQVIAMEMPRRLYRFAVETITRLDGTRPVDALPEADYAADGDDGGDVEQEKRSSGEDTQAPQGFVLR